MGKKRVNIYTGFTLIELLVVIFIVSLLSVIVLNSLNVVRSKARDALRMQSLTQIRNALEMYYAENGNYPLINPPGGAGSGFGVLSLTGSGSEDWAQLVTALRPYISSVAVDPINKDVYVGSCFLMGSHFYTYWNYDGTNKHYSLYASLENPRSSKDSFSSTTMTICGSVSSSTSMYNEKNGGFGFSQ